LPPRRPMHGARVRPSRRPGALTGRVSSTAKSDDPQSVGQAPFSHEQGCPHVPRRLARIDAGGKSRGKSAACKASCLRSARNRDLAYEWSQLPLSISAAAPHPGGRRRLSSSQVGVHRGRVPPRRPDSPGQVSSHRCTAVRTNASSVGSPAGLPARWPQMLGIGSSSADFRCGSSAALSATRK